MKKSRKKHIEVPRLPSAKKYADNLKLLISDSGFQQRVSEIRQYLEIPVGGFCGEDKDIHVEYEKWEVETFFAKSEEMLNSPTLWNKLKEYNEMFERHEINHRQHEELKYKLHDPIPVNYLTRQSIILTEEFNAPLNLKDCIRHYILFNNDKWFTPGSPFSSIRGTNENRHEKSITLTFYSQITDKDWKLIKETVNESFRQGLPDFNPLKDIDVKLAVEKYYLNRDVRDEVDMVNYRLTAREIAENVEQDLGVKIKPHRVYEIIEELEKLRNKRFRKNLGKSGS